MKNKKLKNLIPFICLQNVGDEVSIIVLKNHLLYAMWSLKKHINYKYSMLSCVSGVDFLNTKYRFSIVYDLLSLVYNIRLKVKVFINEISSISSVVSVFINANWWEREIWDLYGLYFNKHPDLRRILTDYGFEGHPMRKDFPLSGFIELRYDEIKKRVVVEPIELTQEFRLFNFETNWK